MWSAGAACLRKGYADKLSLIVKILMIFPLPIYKLVRCLIPLSGF